MVFLVELISFPSFSSCKHNEARWYEITLRKNTCVGVGRNRESPFPANFYPPSLKSINIEAVSLKPYASSSIYLFLQGDVGRNRSRRNIRKSSNSQNVPERLPHPLLLRIPSILPLYRSSPNPNYFQIFFPPHIPLEDDFISHS